MTAYPITNTQEFTDKIKNRLRKYLGGNWDTHYGRMTQVSDDLVYLVDDDYYLTEEVIATLYDHMEKAKTNEGNYDYGEVN